MYRRFSYILPWNLSSGCALVKVFGFVASLLASCKGKKEKKRKKYIPSMRESGALPDEHLLVGL